MALNIKPLPVDEAGNGERLERVVFDRADALLMVHALSIASLTAYMCESKVAANRLEHYRSIFMAMVPPILKRMQREEDVTEIAVAMGEAATWDARQEPKAYWGVEGRCVSIDVGSRTWTTWDKLTDEQFAEMEAAFGDLAPLTCVRTTKVERAS